MSATPWVIANLQKSAEFPAHEVQTKCQRAVETHSAAYTDFLGWQSIFVTCFHENHLGK